MKAKKYIVLALSVIVLFALVSISSALTAKEALNAKLKGKNDIAYAVTAAIKEGYNTRAVVRAAIDMKHAPCLVISTAAKTGANLDIVVLGAIEAGVDADAISKCTLENEACKPTAIVIPKVKSAKVSAVKPAKDVTVAKLTKKELELVAARKAKRAKDMLAARKAKTLLLTQCKKPQEQVVYSAPIVTPEWTPVPKAAPEWTPDPPKVAKEVLQEKSVPKNEVASAPKSCFGRPAKEVLEEKLKEKNDIVYAVTEAIKDKCDAREIVRAAIEMHHAPCLVIATAIKAGANHEQVILGSMEAGATSDVIAKCSLENEGLGYTPDMPSPPSIRTNCIGCGRTTVSTFRFRF